jgi:Cof subfamily protein (haloacid dehalogenase superfamily)
MIRLIAADMDGTLLDSQKRLSPRLFSVIRALQKKNIRFVVASGRQYYTLAEQFAPIKETLLFLAENGGMIFEQDRPIYTNVIRTERVRQLAELGRRRPEYTAVLCGVNGAYMEKADASSLREVGVYYKRLQVVPDLLEAAREEDICKVTYHDREQAETGSYPWFQEQAADMRVILSGDHWVDITNPGVNKGTALTFLQQRLGILPEECMAFGDFPNDTEMMQVCGESYGMCNGHPDLLRHCQYVTEKSNDEDGVVDTLCRVFGL